MLRSFTSSAFNRHSRAIFAGLALLSTAAISPAQYEFMPVSPQWDPGEILGWSPATDPDAPLNRSRTPLASRFSAPSAAENPALSALWNVNSHARPGEGRVQAVTTFNTIPAGGTHGWRTTHLHAPGMWQYTDHLVFWGSSDRNTRAIQVPTAHMIDAAHRNGVRIYGKVFFSWNSSPDNGTLQKIRDLLAKSGETFPVADKLVEAAVYYGFDGWFINQENYQTNATDAQNMRDFLVYFRQKAAASGAPDLRITWYDAMDDNGSRSFQNAFNTNNDGYLKTPAGALGAHEMFMNFWWYYNSTKLSESRTHALSLGLDPYDLHAGIWTENNRTYGNTPDPNGGGNIAITWDYLFPEGLPHHTSVALFGAETPFFKGKTPSGTAAQEQTYWSGPNNDPSDTGVTAALPNWPGIAHYVPANSAITALPFVTNFNTGQGVFYKINGSTLMTGPWTNLSVQDILPTWRWIVTSAGAKSITPTLDFTESYYGGSSLKISGSLAANVAQEVKLYQTRLPVGGSTNLRLIYKPGAVDGALIRVGFAFEDSPGTLLYTTSAAATSTEWTTADFPLGAHAGRTLALITLDFKSSSSISSYSVNVGRIQISNGSGTAPAAPSALVVEGSAANPDEALATQLRLKWSPSPDPVLHYNVYYCQSPGTGTLGRVWLGATPNPDFFVQEVRRIGSENEGYVQIEAVGPDYGVSSPVVTLQPFVFEDLPNLHHPVISSYPVAAPLVVIASSSSSNIINAFDNNLSNFTEPGGADKAWVGLDLGEGNARRITAIRFAPRVNWIRRIINGVFQGSNTPDFSSGVVQLAKVSGPPPEGAETTLSVTDSTPFRYLRYLSPGGGYANIAEIKFYAAGDPVLPPPPEAVQASTNGSTVNLSWLPPATGIAYSYNVKRSTVSGGPYTEVGDNLGATSFMDTGLVPGSTYYYVISSENDAGEGSDSPQLILNPPAALKLAGSVIGFGTPYGSNTHAKAFDGSLGTYFESTTSLSWTGLDLGAGNGKSPVSIRYSPRNSSTGNPTNSNFMIGGRFQVANSADFSDAVTLFTIPGPPAYSTLTSIAFSPPVGDYRYVRYLTAAGRNANISEFEIFASAPDPYVEWLAQSGLIAGDPGSAFDEDHDGDGVLNGVAYMVSGSLETTGSLVTAVIRQDQAVVTKLWQSSGLTHWVPADLNPSPDQNGVPGGFVRMQGQVPASQEDRWFFRLGFTR